MEVNLSILATGLDTVWVLLCAALVFFMEAGFAFLEAGFIRAKNSMNIVMKVFTDCTIGMLSYWVLGFAVMYGLDKGGLFGGSGFLLSGGFEHLQLRIPLYAYWLFQAAFAVAMASIVSGAVAERMKFGPYLIFTALAAGLIYPVAGHWVWGGGWLSELGMLDFAGSAVVHAVGGWSALAAVLLLGPREGKYNPDGTVNVLPAHNMHLAFLGTFILWFGWFGFNPGSSLSGLDLNIARIAVTTNLAAAAGGTTGMLFTMWKYGKADPSMAMNGALAGLAAITAGTAYVTPASAVIIGGMAGVLVVLAVGFFDRVRADDPVGAIAVHGVNGTWGALAVGLFAEKGGLFYGGGLHLLGVQALGVLAVSLWAFTATGLVFYLLKKTVGIRVPASEELEGLDINEHGIPAYAGLVAGSLGEVGVDEFAPDTTCAPEVVSRAAVQK
ncbi:Amt family ammonium transporter [Desulfofundulus luciae]|uniref:Ammonium transporter n=1 Tax=Desulfofundulus luciae TaxID=74702 RepID=A0ABU0B2L2_9FIRM|nr:ammonium transporter [Desulfofundulus luciae]MDQ0286743.1 Amt family ammonium transporter [Desulfofundulus luciae]